MKFLVTGGAGFIGSNIADELLRKGHFVRVLDNFSTGRRENIASIANDIEMIEADIRDYDAVLSAVRGVDVILHQAALPSVPRSIADPITSNAVNITGTLNLLHAAKENNVGRFVMASSSSVYGDTPELPKHEGMKPNPQSPYAVTKLTGEYYCKVFSHVYGIETVALRYFNVFGPRQDPTSFYSAVIPKFIGFLLSGKQPTIYGTGEQSRDFTYISNVVHANYLAGTMPINKHLVCNAACHDQVTLNDLVKKLKTELKSDIEPLYTEPAPGDIMHSFADNRLAEEVLGYKVLVQFEEGLRKTIEFFK